MPYIWGEGTWGPGFWGSPNDGMVFDDTTLYYMGLLIIQYINKFRAQSTVGVFVQEVVAGGLALNVMNGFSLT